MAATIILEFLHRLRIDHGARIIDRLCRNVDIVGAVGEQMSRDIVTRSVDVGE
jgi:hypothetical protein